MSGDAKPADRLVNARLPAVPPWVWLWIALFLGAILPWAVSELVKSATGNTEAIAELQQQVDAATEQCARQASTSGLDPKSVCGAARISALDLISLWLPFGMDVSPYLVLSLGVLLSSAPALARRRNIDKPGATAISPDYPSPAVQALRAEIAGLHPGLTPMACLTVPEITAAVCPISYRRSAIVIGGSLPAIWRRAPTAGRAILAHEVTHWRQGEGWLLNVGSPLVDAIQFIPILVAACVVLPILLGTISGFVDLSSFAATMNARADQMNAMADAMRFSGPRAAHIGFADLAAHFVHQFVAVQFPGMAVMVGGWLCIVLWLILGLVGAFWSAEFTADRAAARLAPVTYVESLEKVRLKPGWLSRLKDLLVHPPVRLRCWAARRAASPAVLLVLLLVFPASLAAGQFALLTWKWFEHFSPAIIAGTGGASMAAALAWLPGALALVSHWMAVRLLACGAAILAWPLLARFIARRMRLSSKLGEALWPYAAGGVGLCVLGGVALAIG